MIHEGLKEASKAKCTVRYIRFRFQGNDVLEGLLSKDYVEINHGYVELTLKGVRALLDYEGLDWRTGKRKQ